MHCFMTDKHSVVLSNQPPKPGWRELPDAPPEPLAPAMPQVPTLPTLPGLPKLADTPGDRFHQLAELRARAEGCSLAEAYSRQASSTPELWADVRNAQPRY